jgi:hypothetical protein
MRALAAELSKLATLPFTWLAFAAGLIVPSGVAIITALTTEPGPDTGFAELGIGVVGAIILGVSVIGSEYATEGEESAGGRQITTSLTVVPSRTRLLLAKVGTVIIATAALAAIAIIVVCGIGHILLGANAPALDLNSLMRMGGAGLYWVMMALIAFALTVLIRNGIVPMAVLVANSSVVTVTYLLAQSIPAANYLPDLAGMRMFTTIKTSVEMTPLVGGLVMAAWVAVLLVIAGAVFIRRDA